MEWLERAYQCRATEHQIRGWLDAHDYGGKHARLQALDLYAVKPPGWLQVFRFTVDVPVTAAAAAGQETAAGSAVVSNADFPGCKDSVDDTCWTRLYGVSRDDQRFRTEIAVFEDAEQRDRLLEQWSEGLSRRKGGMRCQSHCAMDLVWFAAALLGVMLGLAWFLGR